MAPFPIKTTPDGRTLLNLACGIYMHWDWNNVDFNPYTRIVRYPRLAAMLHAAGILSHKRYQRLKSTDPRIIAWDLRRGIPFPDASFDMVYHSHFLEHLPPRQVPDFLRECHRVLKPNGIMRVVVPDLGYWAEQYLDSAARIRKGGAGLEQHERAIDNLIGQMVHHEHSSTREQRPLVRFIERLVRGGTDRTGELHRWMYDRFTLREVVVRAGFSNTQEHTATSSHLPNWAAYCLDSDAQGCTHKPESLFLEAKKES